MELTEKLRLWGSAHAAARAAELAVRHEHPGREDAVEDAHRLREQADRLHGEIYRELKPSREA